MPATPRLACMTTPELAAIDGRISPSAEASIPVTDEGLLRGDGVFEVIRVYNGRPFALPDHLDRIERSAGNLRLGYEVPREELEREIPELLERRGGEAFDGLVRIVLTRGGRRIVLTELLPPSPDAPRLGYVTFAPTRILDGVKSLSYAANMLASRLAQERGCDEALLVTPHGRVLEGPTTALFYSLGDDQLHTPPLEDHILDSITRRHVIAVTGATERVTTTDDLDGFTEAFLASTLREVHPIHRIEQRELPAPGPLTSAAATAV